MAILETIKLPCRAQGSLLLFCQIEDGKPPLPGKLYSISSPSTFAGEVTQAKGGMLHQIPVAFVHTAAGIIGREEHGFICAAEYFPVHAPLGCVPVFVLLPAGQYENKPDLGKLPFQAQNSLCGKGVEAERAACEKLGKALENQSSQGLFQSQSEFRKMFRWDMSMAGKTTGLFFHSITLNTQLS